MLEVESEDDVFKIGTLCQAKAISDKHNPFAPYILNLFPLHKAQVVNFIDPVAPLARVEVDQLRKDGVSEKTKRPIVEDDLSNEELVLFKFLR